MRIYDLEIVHYGGREIVIQESEREEGEKGGQREKGRKEVRMGVEARSGEKIKKGGHCLA